MTIASIWPNTLLAVCATVKIEITQEVTLERQAFDARLQVFNETNAPIENLLVTVTYVDESNTDNAALFYTSFSSAEGMSGKPDGSGRIEGNTTGDLHWLIIPSPGAGGTRPEGKAYWVGATLSFTYQGELHTEVMNPDVITVQPMPSLTLDYFMSRDVIGDDPYTFETEPPVPFLLGVRVANNGYGSARQLKIESGQPEIIDNDQGLLIAFTIIGSEVNGVPGSTDLLVDFGDILPDSAGIAQWNLIATLSGQFISFDASFTHDDALGGELTSLIETVNAHFLAQTVLVDTEGRDNRTDFLAITSDGTGYKVYESDNVERAVADARDTSGVAGNLTPSTPSVRVTCNPYGDPFYVQVPDPGQGRFKLLSATRADGKVLKPQNFQLIPDYDIDEHAIHYALGIFDSAGICDYTITYQVSTGADVTPPTTQARVLAPNAQTAAGLCVEKSTEFIFAATDTQSSVKGMYMQLDGNVGDRSAYQPAISPFRFELRPALEQGPHAIHYYSADASNNLELPKSLNVILDDEAPTLTQAFAVTPLSFSPNATSTSSAATEATFSLVAEDRCLTIELTLEGSAGTSFDANAIVVTLRSQSSSGQPLAVRWNGRDSTNKPLPPGYYTFRARVKDPLGHEQIAGIISVQLVDPLDSQPLSYVANADQLHAVTDGSQIIWQDNRNGDWDVYLFSTALGEEWLTDTAPEGSDQTDPWVEGEWAAWLDHRAGSPRIMVAHLPTQEISSINLAGTHGAPHLQNGILVFEADLDGQYDVYMLDLMLNQLSRVTHHERDQRHPVTNGDWVVFEDYRDGAKPELYALKLTDETPQELRLTVQISSSQMSPTLFENTLMWIDERHGDWDVYCRDLSDEQGGEHRLTYRRGDQQSLSTDGVHWVGVENDGLLLYGTLDAHVTRRLSRDDASRQHPFIRGNLLVWSELMDGNWQLRFSQEERSALVLPIQPGLNLLALPSELLPSSTMAGDLLWDWYSRYGISRVAQAQSNGSLKQLSVDGDILSGTDFQLQVEQTLWVYGTRSTSITVPHLSRSSGMQLHSGLQGLGIASIPYGYGVQELLSTLDNSSLTWIRRFNAEHGRFEVMTLVNGQPSGEPFEWEAGEGILLHSTLFSTVWRP